MSSLVALLLGLTAAAAAEPEVRITGPAETVFAHARDSCASWHTPDAPARAFRDADGATHLFASHFDNRALIGPNLDQVRSSCAVTYRGAQADDPARFDDRAWLGGFFTEDGRTVHALVHNEFHGHLRRELCPTGTYMACWYNSVTAAVSEDGGRTFRRTGVVAAPPRPFAGDRGRQVGYFQPSNIVRWKGAWYATIFAGRLEPQKPGACVIRTERLDDPTAWRAWDGTGFGASFTDPYRSTDDPARHVCTPVGRGVLSSPVAGLVFHQPTETWIATMTRRDGVYVSTSSDLLTWTPARRILEVPRAGLQSCAAETWDYPSLLDSDSPDRNYQTTDDTAWLYIVRFRVKDCRSTQERDLVRFPVGIGG